MVAAPSPGQDDKQLRCRWLGHKPAGTAGFRWSLLFFRDSAVEVFLANPAGTVELRDTHQLPPPPPPLAGLLHYTEKKRQAFGFGSLSPSRGPGSQGSLEGTGEKLACGCVVTCDNTPGGTAQATTDAQFRERDLGWPLKSGGVSPLRKRPAGLSGTAAKSVISIKQHR